jgi:transposase
VKTKNGSVFAVCNPTEILDSLVGLKDVRVLRYVRDGADVDLVVEQVLNDPRCPDCGGVARVKDRPVARYVDLPVYGKPMRLCWRKHRLACRNLECPKKSWVSADHRIAAVSCLLTTRAAKWATRQVGGGRTVKEVAEELGCNWHTVNQAVTVYGSALLAADKNRLNRTVAIGLDETSFTRQQGHVQTCYVTTVADVQNHQIIDLLPNRKYEDVAKYLKAQPEDWKNRIQYGALDMSNTYAAVYSVALPKAAQVVDPFHVVSLANRALDEVRRRVQREQHGHRGRRDDPLYRARRILLMGQEKLTDKTESKRATLLALGDPDGEVAIAYLTKERIRDFYRTVSKDTARAMLSEIIAICGHPSRPDEIRKLGRTLNKWFEKICNYHLARITNAPAEGLNNLIKRVKRVGYGFRNFENYRIRVLLYAGKPNWRTLGSIIVQ